jgi:cell division protein FtsQ
VVLRRSFVRGFSAVVVLAALAVGGWFLVRDSSLARVTQVTVSGATTSEEGQIRAALEDAGREMTTLHVRPNLLEDAVAAYPSVAGLRVETDFPHELSVQVLEHRPVAALEVDGRRTPVSPGGVVLNGVQADRDLPVIRRQQVPGQRIDDGRTLAALTIAVAAPSDLLRRSERLRWGPEGLTVDLRNGPPLYFGTRDAAAAKWAAAARVLAEPSAAGATYLDLRVPGRVGAGGVGPVPQTEPTPDPQP